ncbi:MAG: murein biosynthesis integral membrane protein MurJ [Candidatus Schekmanbacteria bacterium GWA2_38_11]|uniref:Probable lipid II flippase MurJ n=1 Tax=Candidatus Schekmanbacteria bacterium GWA2_38_11 TaxID=1817876 RepID=A0A1F7RMB5_9BACT|nr:MAG: murein biosynthesis integral membrane protein MurJ [Candidatus Schekmanbacteria bacterium GWA2_38_11]
MNTKKKLARAAVIIMAATILSRLAGFAREIIMANYFGLSPARGAFTVAYKIPNLLRTLIADTAISAAFIPVFTELITKENKEEAFKIASIMIGITTIVLSVLTVLSMVFMPYIIIISAPGFTSDKALFDLTVSLSRIIFPTVIFLGITGVITGMLHSFQHFTIPALAPVLWNIVIIAVLVLYQQRLGIYSAAWGILIATVVQLAIQFLHLRGREGKLFLSISFRNPYIKEMLKLIIPVSLSLGIINFNVFVDTIFASYLGPNRLAAIDSAFRIFHLPMGIFAITIGTVLFPLFSTLIAKKDFANFKPTLMNGISQIFFITVPVSAMFIVLSRQIVKIIYQRGQFGSEDTSLVAWALVFFSFGIPFASANTLVNRGFYSLKKNWIPLYVGGINLISNAVLDWLLMKPFSHGGICFSTSLVSAFNFIALIYLIQREVGKINTQPLIKSFLKISFISAIMAACSYILFNFLYALTGLTAALSLSLLSGGIIYITLSWLLKLKEFEIAKDVFLYKKKDVLIEKKF